MRQITQPLSALGRQLAEWRRPLDDDPAVDEAVLRLVRALDRTPKAQRGERDEASEFSRAAAD